MANIVLSVVKRPGAKLGLIFVKREWVDKGLRCDLASDAVGFT